MDLITISEVGKLFNVGLTSAYLYLDLEIIPESVSRKKVGNVWARLWDKDAVLACSDKIAERQSRSGVRGKDLKQRARKRGNNIARKDCFIAAQNLMNKRLIR